MLSSPSDSLHQLRKSVRYKVLLLVLLPLLLIVPLMLGATMFWGYRLTYEQLFIKVNTDLNVANDIFRRLQQDYLDQLTRFGESYALHTALEQGDNASIQQQLHQLQTTQSWTYLQLFDRGQMAQLPDLQHTRQSKALQAALQGQAQVGLEIFTPVDLRQIDSRLEEAVRLPVLPTRYAHPTTRQQEERGMMLRALYPLHDAHGQILAVLDGGVLLNGNFVLVDTIRDLVYGKGRLPEGSIGTVSLFLDNVRISTNVPLQAGERALGTQASAEVQDAVLKQNKIWVDRAFVVNDWYISGYEPLLDVNGQRVGMLCAGYSETPFRNRLWQAVLLLWLLFALLIGLTAWLAIKATRVILSPLEKMRKVIRAISKGETQRIGKLASHDEIAELANGFDAMLELLQQRNTEISQWANQLEHKVNERTTELQQKNADLSHTITLLQTTYDQLVAAEKMAALGELTAGVAHEINNPLAVLLGNLDVMVNRLGDHAQPVQPEINLMFEQIERIRIIINNLLQYACPSDPDHLVRIDLNSLVQQTLKLVSYLHKVKRVTFLTDLQATRGVQVNPSELQHVIVNLIRNAIQALNTDKGVICLSTQDSGSSEVMIQIRDNGCGIANEHLPRIFDPFFTTKPTRQGTGLGLSISYAIVRRYGGRLTVESQVGIGTCFRVYLPE